MKVPLIERAVIAVALVAAGVSVADSIDSSRAAAEYFWDRVVNHHSHVTRHVFGWTPEAADGPLLTWGLRRWGL